MMQLSLILLQFGQTTLMPVLCSMLAQELSKQTLQGMYLQCKWFERWGYMLTPYTVGSLSGLEQNGLDYS